MARYYMLLNWTDQGVRNAKDTVNRAMAAKQTFEKRGAKLLDVAWTMGPYDLIISAEAPWGECGAGCTCTIRSFRYFATSDSTFFSPADYAPVTFVGATSGTPTAIQWGAGTWGSGEAGPRFPRAAATATKSP